MPAEDKRIILELNHYAQKGLYLVFDRVVLVVLTEETIKKTAEDYWNDPSKINSAIRENPLFQRCDFCPLKKSGNMCSAVKTVLPLLEFLDKYNSFEQVFAVYKGEDKDIYYTADTTLQEALKYVVILMLTQHCETGKKFWKYFWGITPLTNPQELAARIFLNIFWFCKGDKARIKDTIEKFRNDITEMAQRQTKRLRLICEKDSMLNAFVQTQIISEFMTEDIEKFLEGRFLGIL
jgi:hypothetical protein